MDSNFFTQAIYLIIILAVIWLVLRFVLKLAQKVFACGCSIILVIGILVFLWQTMGNTP
jgi:hypothetical protein